jgi:hypothetical protein
MCVKPPWRQSGKFGQTGATSASAATCSLCPAGKYSAGATGAAACVLTAPSPDTCYGAAAMIDLLNASCPRDHATQKTTPTSCGTSACAFFISAIDDRKFALVKAGLQVRTCRLLTFGTVPCSPHTVQFARAYLCHHAIMSVATPVSMCVCAGMCWRLDQPIQWLQ